MAVKLKSPLSVDQDYIVFPSPPILFLRWNGREGWGTSNKMEVKRKISLEGPQDFTAFRLPSILRMQPEGESARRKVGQAGDLR